MSALWVTPKIQVLSLNPSFHPTLSFFPAGLTLDSLGNWIDAAKPIEAFHGNCLAASKNLVWVETSFKRYHVSGSLRSYRAIKAGACRPCRSLLEWSTQNDHRAFTIPSIHSRKKFWFWCRESFRRFVVDAQVLAILPANPCTWLKNELF